jgi:hypothetical protein
MIKFIKNLSILVGIFLISFSALAETLPAIPGISNDTQNFLGPIAKGQITRLLAEDVAGALEGEAGPRDYRVNATLGWQLAGNQRLKFTGEYLRQDIDYAFSTGTVRQWVQQGALGLDYVYSLTSNFSNYIDVGGYYSHAPSVSLYNIIICVVLLVRTLMASAQA